MPYIKTVWKDRVVEFARRFNKQNETAETVELIPDPGVVTEAGTPVNAMNLNKIEQGIEDVHNAVDAHEGRTDNPHAVTKAQVALGNVDNYATANQAEAEAGTAANRFMTPQRTKQYVDKRLLNNIIWRVGVAGPEYSTDGGVIWNTMATVKSVQRGNASPTTTVDITISPINPSKSMLSINSGRDGANSSVTWGGYIADSTTLRLIGPWLSSFTLYWEIVEFY